MPENPAEPLNQEIKILDRELKSEQPLQRKIFWGAMLAGALTVAGVAFGGWWTWHSSHSHQARLAASDRFFQAEGLLAAVADSREAQTAGQDGAVSGSLDAGQQQAKLDQATAILAGLAAPQAGDAVPDGIRDYAAMHLATLKAQNGDGVGAMGLWRMVARDVNANEALRGLAAWLLLDGSAHGLPTRPGAAPATPAELRRGYDALIQKGGAFAALGREGLAAVDLGPGTTPDQHLEARRLLADVASAATTSAALRERAGFLLNILENETVESAGSAGDVGQPAALSPASPLPPAIKPTQGPAR
ncbi:hypothetical protein E3E12_00415 [Formicincola oecophyllae]|uniref:Tetratricopeptide repeat-like domain-containing protein n=1 Tax=Formicincola oecophyllae TaxID=2558361 RepID=A0A4Y6U8Z2_9PROT|nr:hypothetical protein [Formicincola oecophyllae]QDH12917.1 hypothetical protein E3E12_00415 [Formicincola oecophyllae]